MKRSWRVFRGFRPAGFEGWKRTQESGGKEKGEAEKEEEEKEVEEVEA